MLSIWTSDGHLILSLSPSCYCGLVCQWSSTILSSSSSFSYKGLMLLTTLNNITICLKRRYPLNPYPHCLLSCQRALPLHRRRLVRVGDSFLANSSVSSAIWVVLSCAELCSLGHIFPLSLILSNRSTSSRNMIIIYHIIWL